MGTGVLGDNVKAAVDAYVATLTTSQKAAWADAQRIALMENMFNPVEDWTFKPEALFEHSEAVNTAGGSSTSGAYRTLPDNAKSWTSVYNAIPSLTESTGVFSVPAGLYYIYAEHFLYQSGKGKLIIFNSSDSSLIRAGVSISPGSTSIGVTIKVSTIFLLAGTKNIAVQYRCEFSKATSGLGDLLNWTYPEIYGYVYWRKLG